MSIFNLPYHKGAIKLAGLYLAILFANSLFFSATIYQLSVQELDRGLRGPRSIERATGTRMTQELRESIIAEREQLYNEASQRVLERLIITNIFILIGGGILSYYLALRTLKPIEEAHEAQSRFTADASHELRTPITAMMTETEVALMEPALTLDDAKKQLASNVEELQKLSALSDGLMRLAGLENGTLHKELTNLNVLIQEAVDRVQSQAIAKQITIKTITPNNIFNIIGDEQSLLEVIVILLNNAIKYSPEQSSIMVKLKKEVHSAVITVADKGVGINATDIPYLFDRFYRADTSRTKQKVHGYGLGLAIAKYIITKHNGSITVKSKPNHGSTFNITLPISN